MSIVGGDKSTNKAREPSRVETRLGRPHILSTDPETLQDTDRRGHQRWEGEGRTHLGETAQQRNLHSGSAGAERAGQRLPPGWEPTLLPRNLEVSLLDLG